MSHRHLLQRLWRGRVFSRELKATFRLALPLMLGELSGMLMGVAGTMMTGRLGATALAASAIASVVYMVSILIIWGSVRMIPTPVSEAHELRNGERGRTLLGAGVLLCVFFWIVCTILLSLGVHFFYLLKQDIEVTLLATQYLRMVIYSLPALIILAVSFTYADAYEYVRLTMVISFIGLLLDILLNWIFIFGHWGFPGMGIKAIGMNMGISHGFMAVLLIGTLLRKKELNYLRNASTSLRAVWSQAYTFVRLGIPSALQMLIEFGAFGIGTVILGQLHKTEQAAHQIALNLSSVTYVTIMGITTAGMIRIGQASAYRSRVRIWLAGMATIVVAMAVMLIPMTSFLLVPRSLVSLYISDVEVIDIAVQLMFFAGLFQLADAAQASGISLLRALNDVLHPSLLSFIAFWVVGTPLGYWLAVPCGWGAQGIWMGYLVALILQAWLFVRRFLHLVATKEL